MTTAPELPLLERRRIEAGVLVPLIRAMQAEFGAGPVNEVVARTIRDLARAQGEADRARMNVSSLADVAARLRQGPLAEGSLIVEVAEESPGRFAFNVRRCRFKEMYEEMGAGDLGFLLSCNRDFAYFAGLAPDISFSRTQTLMEGDPVCDFCYGR
ncbi:MAG: L-2-amino-thiazoline-4-carboxylic acid hydrolase [Dehalococcoidia bacterium]|nr:L-2-amino-thiazoline-4-carboxylic acid hydrolase [Dehalococcoidia bacterium]